MKKTQLFLLISGTAMLALVVLVAVAGPSIYRDFIAPPAADTPTLSTVEDEPAMETGQPLDVALITGEWQVSTGSEAGYRVDEVLNGTDLTVTGRTEQVTGSFTIDASGLTLSSAHLTVDVASIATDQSARDSYFREEALRVSEFPEATFVLTEPVSLDAAPRSGEVFMAEATGNLTIAGVTNSVTAVVEVRSDGAITEIAGTIPITFADYGVESPSLGFVKVEPEGFVEFQLIATR